MTKTMRVGEEDLSVVAREGAVFIGLDELSEALGEDRPVFVVQDTAALAVLRSWNVPAACIASLSVNGGLPEELEILRGADVVILRSGVLSEQPTADLLVHTLADAAKYVRDLHLSIRWPEAPENFTFKLWAESGGTPDLLYAYVQDTAALGFGRLNNDGEAEPFDYEARDTPVRQTTSKFGTKFWREIGRGKVMYPWVIKKIIPAKQTVLSFGESGTGKSFDHLDMAMAVARGENFAGQKVMKGAVVIIAGEAQAGYEKRVKAYRLHHNLDHEDDVEFAIVTKKPSLFENEEEVKALFEELTWIQEQFQQSIVMVVVDTFSSVSKGMGENDSQDVSKMRDVFDRMRDHVGATVVIIHHKAKGGTTPRGHSSFTADFETTIEYLTEDTPEPGTGRKIHTAVVQKQREEERGFKWQFTLPQVVLGFDDDGDKITSCVKEPYRRGETGGRQGPKLSEQRRAIYRSLKFLVEDRGRQPPKESGAPAGTYAVTNHELRDYVRARATAVDDTPEKLAENVRKGVARSLDRFVDLKLIEIYTEPGVEGQMVTSWVWLTEKRPEGFGSGKEPQEAQPEGENREVPV